MNLFISFIFLFSFTANAEFKVAYVDMQKALQSTSTGKAAKTKLEKEFEKKHDRLKKKEKDLEAQIKKFEKTQMILSPQKQASRKAELQKEFMDFQKKLQEDRSAFQRKQQEATLPIIKELKGIMAEIAKKEGYSMIFEQTEHRVMWADQGLNITKNLIDIYEKKKR